MEQYIPKPGDLLPMLPGAALGILFLLTAGWLHRKRANFYAVLFAGTALAAGHFITYVRIQGMPLFPPHQSTERMVYAIGLLALGSTLSEFRPTRAILRWTIRLALLTGLISYLLFPLLCLPESNPSFVAWTTVLSLSTGGLILWILMEDLTHRFKSPVLPLAFSLLMGLYGQILVMYGAAKLALLAGTAAMILGASAALYRWLPSSRLPRATVGVFMALLAGIGLDGYYFISEAPPLLSLVLPLTAVPLLYLCLVSPFNRLRKAPRIALQMAVAAVPFLIAFWIALTPVLNRESSPYDGLY